VDERWRSARRILIIRLDNLGDVILATPAIHAIRAALPSAHLTLLASPTGAQVTPLDPDLDDVIVYRAPWMDPDHLLPQDTSREASMVALLRQRGFDGAIIFTSYHQSSLPAAYLTYQAGVPLRHAASIDGPGSLLTSRHRYPDKTMHEVERGLDLVGGIGFEPDGDNLRLEPPPAERKLARELVQRHRRGKRPLVVIHPGCTCPSRTYPLDRYVEVARAIQRELGAQILWTGSDNDMAVVEQIRGHLSDPGVSLVGQTSLGRLAAVLAEADLVMTNNTGPMHVAAAVKTPVVAFFALTNPPAEWHPWKVPYRLLNRPVDCAICYKRVCPIEQKCLREVPITEVVQAASELLSETRVEKEGA
jgi:ADP-heptose:LPS heptosyltransferase